MYHEKDSFSKFSDQDIKENLDFILYIGFDRLIEYLLPQIAQILDALPKTTLKKIPVKFRTSLLQLIPISLFNPDLLIDVFGIDILKYRIESKRIPKIFENPFRILTESQIIPLCNDIETMASLLFHYDYHFINFQFIIENCRRIYTRRIINVHSLLHPIELIFEGDGIEKVESISPLLHQSLLRLEISKVKLNPNHMKEILKFLSQSECHLLSLSLRQTHLQTETATTLIQAIQSGHCPSLQYIDIGDNNIGSEAVKQLLISTKNHGFKGVCIDSNFFQPSSSFLSTIIDSGISALSICGLHWDGPSADIIHQALISTETSTTNPTTFWNLSAQTVHMHSDPDVTREMSEVILSNLPNVIQSLFFANHNLRGINLHIFSTCNLKQLSLCNSGIESGLNALVPLLSHLEYLDLSLNSIQEKSVEFITSCATSPTLRTLFLSNNNFGDSFGALFFTSLADFYSLPENRGNVNQNKPWTLRMRECGLTKKSSISLIRLLKLGVMKFTELDVGGNQMFHGSDLVNVENDNKTSVEMLFVGSSLAKENQLIDLLKSVKDLKIVEMNRFTPNLIMKLVPYLKGIKGLSACWSRFINHEELIRIINDTKLSELFLVNAISQKALTQLIYCWREIPSLMALHIGQDIQAIPNSRIPIFVEESSSHV